MEFLTREMPGRCVTQLRVLADGNDLRFGDVVDLWQEEPGFCYEWNQALADVSYSAYRWELPGLTQANLAAPFECVLVESLELRRAARRDAFAEHFAAASDDVVVFCNLRGDATLIVPSPNDSPNAYAHLADFVRNAPVNQRVVLWQTVGSELHRRLSQKPVWLSTAGAGVPWLHVRLDDRPKYYSYEPYRNVLRGNDHA